MKNWLKEFIIASIIILLFRIPIDIYYKKLDNALIFFGMFMILVFELTREFLKKPKKEPEPIITKWQDQITKLIESAIALDEKLKELKSKRIPEYVKGAKEKGLFIVEDGNLTHTCMSQENWNKKLNEILREKGFGISYKLGNSNITEKDFSEQLNEHLRGKGFKNDEPFGMAPVEDKEPKCNHSSLRFTIKTGLTTCTICNEVIKLKTPIAPPLGFNHNFHKQVVEVDKELQKKCLKHIKYRKKPVEIEAIQLTDKNILEVYRFINGFESVILKEKMASDYWDLFETSVKKEGLRLKTLESDNETQIVSIGDYVIKGVKGEFYPCKPDIFLLTYDKV